jgi:hypothetical protein
MTDLHHSGTTEALESAFGDRWGIWVSDTGRWWASRRQALTATQTSAGCKPFIHAATAEELAAHLRDQARLDPAPGHEPAQPAAAPAGAYVD